jgi:hypothetical protein
MGSTLPSSAVDPDGLDADPAAAVAILDEDGEAVVLDVDDAALLFALTGDLDDATISACPDCRSRVLACLALVDLLDLSAPHPRGDELVELADDAPSSHCYVHDLASACRHRRWHDPGRFEWIDVVGRTERPPPRPRR